MANTIRVNERNYTVKINHVAGFCTSAWVRIGSKVITSKDYPYRFDGKALNDLARRVRDEYPQAAFSWWIDG